MSRTINYSQLDPEQDARWAAFVEKHPKASIFHTAGWLKALRITYGYEPLAIATASNTDELESALLFCRVRSWLTGNRLVSLPFSDHCEPLCDSEEEAKDLINGLHSDLLRLKCEFMEIRSSSLTSLWTAEKVNVQPSARYFLHRLNLTPNIDEVLFSLDKDSVQRRIKRAQNARLVERCGTSERLLSDFYALFTKTRSRHHIPPSPYAWFRNLIQFLREALEIRVAYQDEQPIAAILTLRFRDVVYYKYGCSDPNFNRFGATSWLLWRAITAGKSNGAIEFDMGRTAESNAGLLAFKNHWVPQPERMFYVRIPNSTNGLGSSDGWKMQLARWLFSCMPDRLLTITGKMIYRHIG